MIGGGLLSETATIGGVSAVGFARRAVAELGSPPNVHLLSRTTAFGGYDGNIFGAVERVQKQVCDPRAEVPVGRLWRIVAKQAILAAGAEERPLLFRGNDLPGVMMAGVMRTCLNRFGVAPGRSAAVSPKTQRLHVGPRSRTRLVCGLCPSLIAALARQQGSIKARPVSQMAVWCPMPKAARPTPPSQSSRAARRRSSPLTRSPCPAALAQSLISLTIAFGCRSLFRGVRGSQGNFRLPCRHQVKRSRGLPGGGSQEGRRAAR